MSENSRENDNQQEKAKQPLTRQEKIAILGLILGVLKLLTDFLRR